MTSIFGRSSSSDESLTRISSASFSTSSRFWDVGSPEASRVSNATKASSVMGSFSRRRATVLSNLVWSGASTRISLNSLQALRSVATSAGFRMESMM
jgi:hypothetical protein